MEKKYYSIKRSLIVYFYKRPFKHFFLCGCLWESAKNIILFDVACVLPVNEELKITRRVIVISRFRKYRRTIND